ncbi:MAG: hypothetical protein LLG04_06000 [Parachlamydia sp.]|nr:hypothetical protein [Parachlamydia sp.]
MMKFAFLSVALMLATAIYADNAVSTAETTVKTSENPSLGTILTDAKGMTLYVFTDDKSQNSVCYDQCAVAWPPLLTSKESTQVSGAAGKLGSIVRKDRKRQVTYNGKPLYYYYGDTNPGDANGQGLENKWFVAKAGS